MKNLIICLILLISLIGSGQSKTEKESLKTTNVELISIEVTIDSVEELESSFKGEDLEELLKMADENEDISFTLNCNLEADNDNLKGSMVYTIKRKANEKAKFLKDIKMAKSTALKFYQLKNKK